MTWDQAFEVIPNLEQSTTPEYWMQIFEANPDALYTLLSDIYFISDYRKTGIRRKKDGMGSLQDLWTLLGD